MFCIHKTCLEGKQRTNLISYLRFGLEMIAANWSWLNSLNIDENFNSAEKLDMMNSLHANFHLWVLIFVNVCLQT